jgi:hypothetical protein
LSSDRCQQLKFYLAVLLIPVGRTAGKATKRAMYIANLGNDLGHVVGWIPD